MRLSRPTVSAVFLTVLALHSRPALAASCESLASLSLPNTTITAVQLVAAGSLCGAGCRRVAPGRPAGAVRAGTGQSVRRPAGVLPRRRDDQAERRLGHQDRAVDAGVRLERQVRRARQRRLGGRHRTGGAGDQSAQRDTPRRRTDTGHEGGSGAFMIGPSREADRLRLPRRFTRWPSRARRSSRRSTATAPKLSYFNGCSTGGRQALTAAQRFPDDFDGIVAGAPAIYASKQSAGQLWIWNATHKDDASFLPPAKYAVLHDAVLAQCDALDGVKDGVLEDPTRCTFDPEGVQCKDADGTRTV